MSDAEKQVKQVTSTNSGEVKTSDWSGGGLAGKVYYMDLGDGFGMLFFIANGKPLYGQIFSPLPETPGAPTERQDIASYWGGGRCSECRTQCAQCTQCGIHCTPVRHSCTTSHKRTRPLCVAQNCETPVKPEAADMGDRPHGGGVAWQHLRHKRGRGETGERPVG